MQRWQEDEQYDYMNGKRRTVMILIAVVITLIGLSILGGVAYLIRTVCSSKGNKDQDGSYRLLPKSDDEDADDEFDIPAVKGQYSVEFQKA